jgi:mannose-1-phosphate guanylyltransferase/mannose-6-phosphate isomerase
MISLVLSGGKGERLWPVSREKLPKPFAPFFDSCLLTQTIRRLSPMGEVWICTSESLCDLTESQIRQDQLSVGTRLYEPQGRNTAPAIALAVRLLQQQGQGEQVLGVFPSDHWIEKLDVFKEALELAQNCAQRDFVVTLGIQPDHPATGFGYIQYQTTSLQSSKNLKAHPVVAFTEKPHLEQAEQYLQTGQYVWNSGMFVFKVNTMAELFAQHMPQLWKVLSDWSGDMAQLDQIYTQVQPQSIDYGIMEKIKSLINIPVSMGWSDLGSWDDLAEINQKHPVHSQAHTHVVSGANNFVHSLDPKSVHLLGVSDLIVVDTQDALLITRRGQSQKLRHLVDEIKESQPQLMVDHSFERRPWGEYRNLYEQEGVFKTKVIEIHPQQQLSYQSHQHRTEIWVVVQGEGEVILNDESIPVQQGSVVQVLPQAKHRMRNTHPSQPLKFVEVQLGSSFSESDITRYQDDYGRN